MYTPYDVTTTMVDVILKLRQEYKLFDHWFYSIHGNISYMPLLAHVVSDEPSYVGLFVQSYILNYFPDDCVHNLTHPRILL